MDKLREVNSIIKVLSENEILKFKTLIIKVYF